MIVGIINNNIPLSMNASNAIPRYIISSINAGITPKIRHNIRKQKNEGSEWV